MLSEEVLDKIRELIGNEPFELIPGEEYLELRRLETICHHLFRIVERGERISFYRGTQKTEVDEAIGGGGKPAFIMRHSKLGSQIAGIICMTFETFEQCSDREKTLMLLNVVEQLLPIP